jgi:hypothetical protein
MQTLTSAREPHVRTSATAIPHKDMQIAHWAVGLIVAFVGAAVLVVAILAIGADGTTIPRPTVASANAAERALVPTGSIARSERVAPGGLAPGAALQQRLRAPAMVQSANTAELRTQTVAPMISSARRATARRASR